MILLLHEPSGFLVDAEAGVIFGKRGRVVGTLNDSGYLTVSFVGAARSVTSTSAQRIVFEAAHGPIPAGYEIGHRNHCKVDNRLINLELVTHSENAQATWDLMSALEEAAALRHEQKREVLRTGHLVTAGEWAESLGVSPECVQALRVKALNDAASFARALSQKARRNRCKTELALAA